jgi:hypothetical protein
MTLLSETKLSQEFRFAGFQALLWHDVLEDTTLPLPDETSTEVRNLVEEMTFKSFEEERENIWSRSERAQLLKLYDKVSNLLDATWMSDSKWDEYATHTKRLTRLAVERFGELNIVQIARAVTMARSPDGAA